MFSRVLLSLGILFGSLIGAFLPVANAQTGDVGWSTPYKVLDAQGSNSEPVLAADQTGRLHAFWTYAEEDSPVVIYCAQWDGNEWTQPVDIVVASTIQGPSAVADRFGRLHLIWQGSGNTLLYSSARVEDATSALGWTSPVSLAQSNPHAHIVTGHQGNLHIVYPGIGDTGVYYTASTDGGATWQESTLVAAPANGRATTDFARIAAAPGGAIHVVWTELKLPSGMPSLGIYYAKSKDGGQTWTSPEPLGTSSTSIEANIIAVSDDEIYLAWNESGAITGRYLRWSGDGGDSWSDPLAIASPDLHGSSTNPPGLAIDSAGTVHAVVNTRPGGIAGTDAAMYVHGRRGRWSPPEDVSQRVPDYVGLANEASAIAITAGNRISIVFMDNDGARLWHTWKTAGAPAVTAPAFLPDRFSSSPVSPAKSETPAPSPTIEVTAVPTPTNTCFSTSDTDPSSRVSTGPAAALVIGILPTLVVVGGVVLFKLTRRRTY